MLNYNKPADRKAFGAGGWVTMLRASVAHNVLVARTDTYNGYWRDLDDPAGGWEEMFKPGINVDLQVWQAAMNAATMGLGTYDSVVAADKTFYATCLGRQWKKPWGQPWQLGSVPLQVGTNPNSYNRPWGQPLQVDERDSDHVWFAGEEGVFWTIDGWETHTFIPTATIPGCTPESRSCVAFDYSQPAVNGRTDRVIIGVVAATGGVYQITGMGAASPAPAVTKLPGRPTNPTLFSEVVVNPSNGDIFVSGGGNHTDGGQLSIYRRGTSSWVEPAKALKCVTFDRAVAGRVWGCIGTAELDRSDNEGLNWQLPGDDGATVIIDDGEVGWHDYLADKNFVGAGNLVVPANGKIHTSGGIAAWVFDNLPTGALTYGTPVTLRSISRGIENTVVQQVSYSRVKGHAGASKMDRGTVFLFADKVGKSFPDTYGVNNVFQFGQGHSFPPTNEDVLFGTSAFGERHLGYTQNGVDWTEIRTLIQKYPQHDRQDGEGLRGPPGGGAVVALTEDCLITVMLTTGSMLLDGLAGQALTNAQAEHKWNAPHVSFDKGKTWEEIPCGTNRAIYNGFAYYMNRRTLVPDKFVDNRVWFYNPSNVDQRDNAAVVSDVGDWCFDVDLVAKTVTVTRVSAATIRPFNYDSYDIDFVQYDATTWLQKGSDDAPGLLRSTNSRVSWSEVIGSDDKGWGDRFGVVWGVAVGPPQDGSTHPTVTVVGHRRMGAGAPVKDETTYGWWRQTEPGGEWKLIAIYPLGLFDRVNSLAAHPWRPGVLLVGFKGAGLHQIADEHSFVLA